MEINEINEMTKILFDYKITAHIETFKGFFYNGLIIERSDKLIVIHDIKLGDTPIAVSQIKEIDRFVKRGGGI